MYLYLWDDLLLMWLSSGANGSSPSKVIWSVCLILRLSCP